MHIVDRNYVIKLPKKLGVDRIAKKLVFNSFQLRPVPKILHLLTECSLR